MNCENIRQILLELGLDEATRKRIADALAHVEHCESCQSAMTDFDRIVAVLQSGATKESSSASESVTTESADESNDVSDNEFSTAQSDATPTGGWEAFGQRLQAAVDPRQRRRQLIVDSQTRPSVEPNLIPVHSFAVKLGTILLRWLPWSVVAATCVLLVVGMHRLQRGELSRSMPLASAPTADAWLLPDDVAKKVVTFREMDELFDGHAHWLRLSNDEPHDEPQFEFSPRTPSDGSSDVSTRNVLLVRLSLSRNAQVFSNAEVLIVPGITANVTVPTRDGPPLRYQLVTSAVDPTRLAVRLEVAEPAGNVSDVMSVLGTNLHVPPYRNVNAGRLMTQSGAYDLRVIAAPSPVGEGKT